MYQSIVERLVSESKRVHRIPLETKRIEKTAKSLSRLIPTPIINDLPVPPQELIQPKVAKKIISKPIVSTKKVETHKIPISKPIQSRFPTKRVDFDDGVFWL